MVEFFEAQSSLEAYLKLILQRERPRREANTSRFVKQIQWRDAGNPFGIRAAAPRAIT